MATSGSTNWNPTRDEIIKAALRKVSGLDAHNTPPPENITAAAFSLNALAKSWMAEGIDLWLRRHITLFLQPDTQSYLLGSTAHATESYVETTMRVAASSTDTTMEVVSTTGMTDGDYCGVLVDDDTIHWTTCTVTDGDTLELATGVDDDAAIGNQVYTYTARSGRPQKILTAIRRDTSDNDAGVQIVAMSDYMALGNKTTDGAVNQIVYDPQLTAGVLRVWPTGQSNTHKLVMVVQDVVEDFDVASDTAEFPQEWARALVWNLAEELMLDYPVSERRMRVIARKAAESYRMVWEYDVEEGPLLIQPDMSYG